MLKEYQIKSIKEKYPRDTKIELISMEDNQAVPSGTNGVVDFVDDMGTIHVTWENGSSLGLIVGVDQFKVIDLAPTLEEKNKPVAPIIGANGNVFNLLGICSRALKDAGYSDEVKEMVDRVTNSHSYDEALAIMQEYIEPVDQNYEPLSVNDSYDDIGVRV